MICRIFNVFLNYELNVSILLLIVSCILKFLKSGIKFNNYKTEE